MSVQCCGSDDEEDPNSSAAETHAQDGREVFEGVARLCKVETSVVTRCLACKRFLKRSKRWQDNTKSSYDQLPEGGMHVKEVCSVDVPEYFPLKSIYILIFRGYI